MITNISAYLFATLSNLKPLRDEVLEQCRRANLKGTILLSTEGLNLFVAGSAVAVAELLARLRSIPGLENLTPKYSESAEQPFTRMLVKIKKEIISFGVEGIDPVSKPAPRISPREFKQWLDEGRPVTVLDTRNDYEVKLGTFRNAVPTGIDHFRQFPAAVARLPDAMKHAPVVTFCTGGIRCEKAAPYLQQAGFTEVYQLDGGILKYFDECGSAHYDGECFVFDQRVGVDPSLHETEHALCFACQMPLTPEEQADSRYQPPHSCPHCYRSSDAEMAVAIVAREAALRRWTSPLPGSTACENDRPLNVTAEYDGRTLLEFLTGVLPHTTAEFWQERCEQGRLLKAPAVAIPRRSRSSRKLARRQGVTLPVPATISDLVRGGEIYLNREPAQAEPPVNADIRILHEDAAIIVLHKPAPLPMHPCGRFNQNTLQSFLAEVYAPERPRPAHRLDANTSGVVVFTRTRHVAHLLQSQFEQKQRRENSTLGAVIRRNEPLEKIYLARVQGHPPEDRFSCDAPISVEAGVAGSREIDADQGLPSLTHFEVLHRDTNGTSLLRVIPITGRTNQIRLHLWYLGWPICGDQTYLPDRKLGAVQTVGLNDQPLCLLAQEITFIHPLTRERMTFCTGSPAWAMRDDR